jgi:hypothetical protein
MTFDVATKVLRNNEPDMGGVEIALVTYLRHQAARVEVLAAEQAALVERIVLLESR